VGQSAGRGGPVQNTYGARDPVRVLARRLAAPRRYPPRVQRPLTGGDQRLRLTTDILHTMSVVNPVARCWPPTTTPAVPVGLYRVLPARLADDLGYPKKTAAP